MSEEKTITIKKDTLWKVGTFLFAVLFVIAFFGGFSFNKESSGTGSAVAPTQPTAPSHPSQVKASADDDAFLGEKNAPVEIIEFSDYQCPFCRKFWTETLPSRKQEYIDTGKVKFVYRDFPLDSIHPGAQPAA